MWARASVTIRRISLARSSVRGEFDDSRCNFAKFTESSSTLPASSHRTQSDSLKKYSIHTNDRASRNSPTPPSASAAVRWNGLQECWLQLSHTRTAPTTLSHRDRKQMMTMISRYVLLGRAAHARSLTLDPSSSSLARSFESHTCWIALDSKTTSGATKADHGERDTVEMEPPRRVL